MTALRKARLRAAVLLAAAAPLMAAVSERALASTIGTVRERGEVVCGVSEHRDGLSAVDERGRWSGLEVEFCGALAAAVFGDRHKVKFRPVTTADGARVLTGGQIDVLLAGAALTLSREAELGMRFAGVLFHDGQGLLVQRAFGVSSALELSGSSICVQKGTSAAKAVAAYFDERDMRYQLVLADKWDEAVKTYREGNCTLLTGDVTSLAHERSRMARPNDHLLLPETMTHEQTGPMVREGDAAWLTLVRWTLLALIEAEQIGLTSETVQEAQDSPDERVRRFLGKEAALGAPLGLSADWTERIIAQVGNYGEIFDRTLGERSRLKLPRGANNLWSKGGLMSSPAFR